MFKKKYKNYGSYDELHEGIYKNKHDKDPWIPNRLFPNRALVDVPYGNHDPEEGLEDPWMREMNDNDLIKAGVLTKLNGKLVPGPNANKRFVKTRYGVEFYPEYVERKIKQKIYNNLASKYLPNLVPFSDFNRMSFDEIDSLYNPTKRYYEYSDTRCIKQEKEFERRRRLWEKDSRKKGIWWTDLAKKQVREAYANSVVEYDKNMLALVLRSNSNHPWQNVPENKIEQARLIKGIPVDYPNQRIEAIETNYDKKKNKKKHRKLLTEYDSGTTLWGWLKKHKLVIGSKKVKLEPIKTHARKNMHIKKRQKINACDSRAASFGKLKKHKNVIGDKKVPNGRKKSNKHYFNRKY